MKITAAVVREASGPFTIEEIELDEPRDDEVLVRIVGVGLCGKKGYQVSFWEFIKMGLPFTLAAVISASIFVWFIWQ